MKTVVITGASTGIGRAAAEHLAGKGWRVFAGVRKHSDGEPLKQASGNITPLILDVAKPDQVKAAVETVSKALSVKTLYGLVNNAGIAKMGAPGDLSLDDFQQLLSINVPGIYTTTADGRP
ncbi:MAG: SDR family NAD(P)-dependent oxidoreductase, partial [Henriciella sp.]|nr:SDR family NAD(P)-dependent oxidoreductase [Henriciella sp.]